MMDIIRSKKYLLIILLSVGVLVFLFNLGGRDLWDPDETRYAVVAREMRESGNWILPHLNGNIYAEKPPLYFWLVNFTLFFLGEESEFVNRLPSALAGLITILITFLFGERLFNARVGFLSGLVLVTCFFFPQISRWMMLDSLLVLFFLLTLYCFYLGYEKEEGRRKYYLFAGLFMGLGVLTKGPIAYLPLPIFVIFAFFHKEIKKFWNWDLLLGFLLSLVVVLIWLIPACLLGGEDYTKRILFGQAIGRLAGSGKHFHPELYFFYFVRFPVEFLPWTIFLPSAILFGLRKGKNKESLLIFIWFIFVFLFFTLSRGKKDNYILPLYPAVAMMVGVLWDSQIRLREEGKGFILGFLFIILVPLIGSVLFLTGVPQRLYPALTAFYSTVLSVLLYLLVGSFLSLFFFYKKRRWASFICLAVTFTVFHLHLSYSLPSKFNTQRSMKAFSEKVLKRMKEGDGLKMCFFRSPGLLYYTRRPLIEEIWEKGRFLEVLQLPQRVFIVIQWGDLDQLKRDLQVEIVPVEQMRVWHWDLTLVSNR
jgi:4-amino-4-deoxy-L-arabinose transferase-like glycosyltransferase